MTYRFRPGRHPGGDPQAVGERLAAMAERDGSLTPAAVVADARPADSPLHRYFEWDDARAAERHRVDRARALIRCVYVETATIAAPAAPPRIAYVHVPQPDGGQCYRPVAAVLSDDEQYLAVLADALRALEALRRRYGHLLELADVFRASDRARRDGGRKTA